MYTRNRKRRDDREHCIIRNNIICTIYLTLAALSNTEIHTTYMREEIKYRTSVLQERSQLRDAIVRSGNY
jgi:hypothetical protein